MSEVNLSRFSNLGITFDIEKPWDTRDVSDLVRAQLTTDLSPRVGFQVIANTLHLILDGSSRGTIDLKSGNVDFLDHDRSNVHELLALLQPADPDGLFAMVYEQFREEGRLRRVDQSMVAAVRTGLAAREVSLVMGDLASQIPQRQPEIFPVDEVLTVKTLEKTRTGMEALIRELLERRPSRVEVDSDDREVNRSVMSILGIPVAGTKEEYELTEDFFTVADFYLRASSSVEGEALPRFFPKDRIAMLRVSDAKSRLSVSIDEEKAGVVAVSMLADFNLMELDEKNDQKTEVARVDSAGKVHRLRIDGDKPMGGLGGLFVGLALKVDLVPEGGEGPNNYALIGKEGGPLQVEGIERFKTIDVFDSNCPLMGVALEDGIPPPEGVLFYERTESRTERYYVVDLGTRKFFRGTAEVPLSGKMIRPPLAHSAKGNSRRNLLTLPLKVLEGEYCYEQVLFDPKNKGFVTIEGQQAFSGKFGDFIVTSKGELLRLKKTGESHHALYELKDGNAIPTELDACEYATTGDNPTYLVRKGGQWHFTQNLNNPKFKNISLPGGERIDSFDEYRELPMISSNPSNCLHALRRGDKWIIVAGANDVLNIDGEHLFDLPSANEVDRNFTVQTLKGPITIIWSYGFEYQSPTTGQWKRS